MIDVVIEAFWLTATALVELLPSLIAIWLVFWFIAHLIFRTE